MNLIIFGAPGAGKGTQCALLVERLKYFQISTGDLLRGAIKLKTQLGQTAQSFMDKGLLVPDDVVIGLIDETLDNNKGKQFILDGFPRNTQQAEALDKMLQKKNLSVGKVLFLEVPEADLMDRLTGRRVCKSCGSVFHLTTKPPQMVGKCDVCGGELFQRPDDKSEVIGERLKVYRHNTLPLRDYYAQKKLLQEVDGNRATEEVFGDISREIV